LNPSFLLQQSSLGEPQHHVPSRHCVIGDKPLEFPPDYIQPHLSVYYFTALQTISEHTDQIDLTYSGVDANVQAVRAPPSLISTEIAIVSPPAQTLAGRQTSVGILGDGCVGEAAHRVNAVGGDARHITIVWKERAIGGVALRRYKAQEKY
jgi:hypothetical protein